MLLNKHGMYAENSGGMQLNYGPGCLHDILDFTDIPVSLRMMVPNYVINVISIRKINNTDVFKTDLKHVLDFLRFSEDENKLEKLIKEEPYFSNMEEDAYDVVTNYTNIMQRAEIKKVYVEEGKIDMCKGLQSWMEREKTEGRAEGRAEGIVKTARKYNATD